MMQKKRWSFKALQKMNGKMEAVSLVLTEQKKKECQKNE